MDGAFARACSTPSTSSLADLPARDRQRRGPAAHVLCAARRGATRDGGAPLPDPRPHRGPGAAAPAGPGDASATLPSERAGVTPACAASTSAVRGDVTFDLASLVGITGHVVGVDLDPAQGRRSLAATPSRPRWRTLSPVGRPDPGLGEAEYDVVYARFLLTHLRDPAAAVALIRRALRRAGGRAGGHRLPGVALLPRVRRVPPRQQIYEETARRNGGDPTSASGWPACCSTPGSSGSSPPSRTRSASRAR